ncbi:hypothetical protein WJX73_004224 [Symbiochloris irregularis]|uniref:F-box domain-containing protein n=1 Tax=Symbiochloris irregularis TaxID=706552 RepID=A0AAW1NUZ5_9CHLO
MIEFSSREANCLRSAAGQCKLGKFASSSVIDLPPLAQLSAEDHTSSTATLLGVVGILNPEIFPALEAQSLAALACTSKELKSLVYGAPASVWEAAARRFLPKQHPPCAQCWTLAQ